MLTAELHAVLACLPRTVSSPRPPTGLADGFGPEEPYGNRRPVLHPQPPIHPRDPWVPGFLIGPRRHNQELGGSSQARRYRRARNVLSGMQGNGVRVRPGWNKQDFGERGPISAEPPIAVLSSASVTRCVCAPRLLGNSAHRCRSRAYPQMMAARDLTVICATLRSGQSAAKCARDVTLRSGRLVGAHRPSLAEDTWAKWAVRGAPLVVASVLAWIGLQLTGTAAGFICRRHSRTKVAPTRRHSRTAI
jgi:hypothetical protein